MKILSIKGDFEDKLFNRFIFESKFIKRIASKIKQTKQDILHIFLDNKKIIYLFF